MAFKIFLLDLLMALDADANPTRAAFDSALNRTFAHDVRRIDVDQKVVAQQQCTPSACLEPRRIRPIKQSAREVRLDVEKAKALVDPASTN